MLIKVDLKKVMVRVQINLGNAILLEDVLNKVRHEYHPESLTGKMITGLLFKLEHYLNENLSNEVNKT